MLTELVSSQAIARQTATVRITPVTKEVVEERLKRYGGDDSRLKPPPHLGRKNGEGR
jgi:hypothetical protein